MKLTVRQKEPEAIRYAKALDNAGKCLILEDTLKYYLQRTDDWAKPLSRFTRNAAWFYSF